MQVRYQGEFEAGAFAAEGDVQASKPDRRDTNSLGGTSVGLCQGVSTGTGFRPSMMMDGPGYRGLRSKRQPISVNQSNPVIRLAAPARLFGRLESVCLDVAPGR